MKVRLDNIGKRYASLRGRIDALKGVNLEISDREFFVLLGPSGCGKSTLLNLIAGLEKPSTGSIRFDDRLVSSAEPKRFVPPKKRNVAMVFQNYALYPHMNVFDNIAFPLRIARESAEDISAAVEETAGLLRVSELMKARPAELSGGQRQRVAIARAIVRRPDIFLLDEPLSNLDAQLRLTMRTELKNLQRSLRITTVYVTHDQAEAMTLGNRVAVINNGRIEQVGAPDEIYSHPVNIFVATFIGSPPMNILKGILRQKEDGQFLEIDNREIKIPSDLKSYIRELPAGDYTFGIRPEHIKPSDRRSDHTLHANIVAVEHLGHETILHLRVGRQHMTALVGPGVDSFNAEETIEIELNINKIHIFR